MPSSDLTRNQVNRIYRGFNADCGQGAEQFCAPVVTQPCPAHDFIRLGINATLGRGHWDVGRVHDGMLMCLAECHYSKLFDYVVTPPSNILSIRMVAAGGIEIADRRGRNTYLERGIASITSVPTGHTHQLSIVGRQRFASVTIHVRADRLTKLMGLSRRDTPPLLASFTATDPTFQSCTMPLTAAMANGVFDLVNAPYRGALLYRFFEAKTMEMLCLFIDAMQHGDGRTNATGTSTQQAVGQVRMARQILEQHFVAPPTVEQLARQVGVNRTRLRADFKRVYGTTMAEFVQMRRMGLAKQLLFDANLSIRTIAEAVGYHHAGNFSAAFRRYYGHSPKHYRS